jgi:nucleoside-diphosphate-sugar epimerase
MDLSIDNASHSIAFAIMEPSETTVFVTGATGVLGRSVVNLLRTAGYRVRSLCRSTANLSVLRQLGTEPVTTSVFDAKVLSADMTGIDAILHLATHIPPTNRMKRAAAWHDNDCLRRDATRTIVDAALATTVQVIVYPSVCRVYADGGANWQDALEAKVAPARALDSTLAAERELARFSSHGRRGIVLRMGQFYGPESGHTQDELRLARWGFASLFGRMDAYRSMIWIHDAAAAVVDSMVRATRGIYDVVDDEPLTNCEALEALAQAVGHKKLRPLPHWVLKQMIGKDLCDLFGRSQRVSNRRLRETTSWRPLVATAREGWALVRN